ncbi:AAA family ATPase [uncultured Brachyspira sp.]|jgi:hypothetical protein|uniref:ATP-dependent nuclease n=1 Tax=uncultured Brachyspira sp. TaxID=221953 RepID=UPI003209A918
MYIKKIKIQNFKCFKNFELDLNKNINIIVGNNESGKSTLLEAIHLALTGVLDGKYLKNEINPYLFNMETTREYISSVNSKSIPPPMIIIELYFDEQNGKSELSGDGNIGNIDATGISFKILFNDDYKDEYAEFINNPNISIIPIEFYKIEVCSFARERISYKSIPIKSILIDSSSNKLKNGSDMYLSYVINNSLTNEERIAISNAHIKMKSAFIENESIKNINNRMFNNKFNLSKKQIELSVDFLHNNWENTLMTYIEDIPFQYIGKGEQCYIKTNIALLQDKAKDASLILLEEPESHLSHSKLNSLLKNIEDNINNEHAENKQIIISTHSSFVANKMSLNNIIIIDSKDKAIHFNKLAEDTFNFFKKAAGYDTLRLILSKKSVLVEGASDELIFQKAYKDKNNKLPIEDEIEVISVGTSFLRYLELSKNLNKKIIMITDNDGKPEKLKEKYKIYIDNPNIKICYEEKVNNKSDFDLPEGDNDIKNIDTLEPNLLKVNNIELFNKIFDTKFKDKKVLLKYMLENKVECALKIFDYTDNINYPNYINEAVNECEK